MTTNVNGTPFADVKADSIRIPISQEDFNKFAEMAAETGDLKRREGEFGAEFAIFLNGHLMMISQVNCEDEREFFKCF